MPRAYAHAPAAIALAAIPAFAPLAFGDPVAAGPWIGAGVVLLGILTGLVRAGALYRLGVADDPAAARRLGLGPLGLQFGKPELRLAAGGALVTLFLLLVAIAGFVVAVFIASAAGLGEVDWSTVRTPEDFLALGEPWKLGLVAAAPIGLALVLAVLATQLSLFAPATIGRERVTSLDALALADGHFFKLFIGLLLVSLPTLGVALARQGTGGGDATAWLLAEGLVAGLVQAPLTAGFLSAAYRRLEYVQASDRGDIVHG